MPARNAGEPKQLHYCIYLEGTFMKFKAKSRYAFCCAAALAILAGCSGSDGSSPGALAVQDVATSHDAFAVNRMQPARTGSLTDIPIYQGAPIKGFFSKAALAPGGATAFISAGGGTVVYVVNAQGVMTATLTGFSAPDGMSTDNAGNLYVTNNSAANVFELAPPYNGPPTVYSDPNQYPIGVAVDGHGDLAVTSLANMSGGNGQIALYKAGSTSPTSTIQDPNFRTLYAAFDASGNLYVDGENANFTISEVGEVVGGVNGTSISSLTYNNTICGPGGVQVTKTGDIAIDDQCGLNIYTYNPPSNGSLGSPVATTPLSGAKDPQTFALSRNGAIAAVADPSLGQAEKYAYPSGGSPILLTNLPPDSYPIGVAINPTAQYARF